MTTVATLAPTCEARVGFGPGEWEPMPLWCNATVGLTTWTDSSGQTHRACRHHVAGLRYRYPEATQFSVYVSRDAMIPCAACVEGGPPHYASPKCESGARNHCSCDRCF